MNENTKLQPVPLFYNPHSGSIKQMLKLLQGDPRVVLEATPPEKMAMRLKQLAEEGAKRLLVSGGDGTIALAAEQIVGSSTELALIPGGTLNHFAERQGIPTDVSDALDLAIKGKAHPVNVGFVNDSIFINTSSVGAYTVFVRSRKHLKHRMNYISASVIAGLRRLTRLRSILVSIEGKQIRTPLVFVGVEERELLYPSLGQAKAHGLEGLHVIAINCSSRRELFKLIFGALFLGIDPLSRKTNVESQILDSVELNFRHHKRLVQVALDGELTWLRTPLKYRFSRDVIKVVTNQSR